jgi:type IV pilus assembly protein PilB
MLPLKALDEKLLKLRREAEEREAKQRALRAGLEYLDLTTAPVSVDALALLDEKTARAAGVAVFVEKRGQVGLAVLDPGSPDTAAVQKELAAHGFSVKTVVGSRHGLEHLWSFYAFATKAKAPITSRVNIEKDRILTLQKEVGTLETATARFKNFDYENFSVADLLEIAIAGALANRASDIHFEPEEKAVKLRYRVDGILHDVYIGFGSEAYAAIVSRIKLLSNLKINVADRPQDGRFTIGLGSKDVEIRVAIAPSEFGEIIVMRILDPDAINLSLSDLGLRKDDLDIIEVELKRPNGMILNTGPTGSGKTTTLYAFLRAKLNSEIKIITIEDPVEYHVLGLEQTQVHEESGYTFANGLKSIMRQDPDAILVGEVRDKETAEIAIQAALTGHLVFSTVHANEAAGAIPRFLDLGVRPTSLGPALNLIIGQRLVRKLCAECKKPTKIRPPLQAFIANFLKSLPARVDANPYATPTLFEPVGCAACAGSGYRGRVAAFELLLNDPEFESVKNNTGEKKLGSEHELEELILRQAGESEILHYALSRGMVTMRQDGMLKVLQGITTWSEVEEVTGAIPGLESSLI